MEHHHVLLHQDKNCKLHVCLLTLLPFLSVKVYFLFEFPTLSFVQYKSLSFFLKRLIDNSHLTIHFVHHLFLFLFLCYIQSLFFVYSIEKFFLLHQNVLITKFLSFVLELLYQYLFCYFVFLLSLKIQYINHNLFFYLCNLLNHQLSL